jgi:alanine dehydrogenase
MADLRRVLSEMGNGQTRSSQGCGQYCLHDQRGRGRFGRGNALAHGFATRRSNVVMISAGLTGLATAQVLESTAARMTVLVANARVGARSHTIERDGVRFEVCGVQVGSNSSARPFDGQRVIGTGTGLDGRDR